MNTIMSLEDLVTAWSAFYPAYVLKGSLILIFVACAFLFLRKIPASLRHFGWLVALGGVWIIPVSAQFLPVWKIPVLPADHLPSIVPQAHPGASLPALSSRPVRGPEEAVGASQGKSFFSVQPGIYLSFAGWLLGVLGIFGYFLHGAVSVRTLVSHCRPVEDAALQSLSAHLAGELGLRHSVPLLESEQIGSPAIWGFWRPVILLPADRVSWNSDFARMILLHELAHIRRGDNWTQLVGQLSCAILWVNPLAWYALRQLRLEREQASDDLVIKSGIKPSEYAGMLLSFLGRQEHGAALPGIAAMAHSAQFKIRLAAILSSGKNRSALSWRPAFFGGSALILATFFLAAARVESQEIKAVSVSAAPLPEPAGESNLPTGQESGKTKTADNLSVSRLCEEAGQCLSKEDFVGAKNLIEQALLELARLKGENPDRIAQFFKSSEKLVLVQLHDSYKAQAISRKAQNPGSMGVEQSTSWTDHMVKTVETFDRMFSSGGATYAYLSIQRLCRQAKQLLSNQDSVGAKSLFEKASFELKQFRKMNPEWKPGLVDYDLKTIQQALHELNQPGDNVGSDTRPCIVAVNPAWNFVVINLGEKQGISSDTELSVQRANQIIGKVRVADVKSSTSIANIVPGSVPKDIIITTGDQIVYQKNKQ